MASFKVAEVFRLPSRQQYVIAGQIEDGTITVGMNALIWMDGRLIWKIPIVAVEYTDRIHVGETLVGLVCDESLTDDATWCNELSAGTVIEVRSS